MAAMSRKWYVPTSAFHAFVDFRKPHPGIVICGVDAHQASALHVNQLIRELKDVVMILTMIGGLLIVGPLALWCS